MSNYLDDEAAAARHDAADDYDYASAADHMEPYEYATVERPYVRVTWRDER